jgi:hypothetical protein
VASLPAGRRLSGKRRAEPLGPLTVLTRPQLAAWLKVSERTVDRLQPPALALSEGVKRYLLQDVLAWLRARGGKAA